TSPLPHTVLGLPPGASKDEARRAYRKLVRDNHPDVLIARGLPEEAIMLAQKRLIDINRAWETFERRAG
ncbi:J domain-containing protein, partial [Sulfitobacter sp. HI0040]